MLAHHLVITESSHIVCCVSSKLVAGDVAESDCPYGLSSIFIHTV
jgi:hypothetical protein